MNCEKARNLLNAFHEKRLAPELLEALKQHLASCPDCDAEEKKLRKIHENLLGLFSAKKLPLDFDKRVMNAIQTRRSPALARKWTTTAWTAIASAAIIGITLIFMSLWHGEVQEPENTSEVAARDIEAGTTGKVIKPTMEKNSQQTPPRAPREINIPAPDESPEMAQEEMQQAPFDGAPGQTARKPSMAQKTDEPGHGKTNGVESDLLASPLQGQTPPESEREKRQRKERPDANGLGRPGMQGGRKDPEERQRKRQERENGRELRKRREEMAEKARERQGEPGMEEIRKLPAQDRKKLASAMKDSVDKGAPGLVAARVVQLVLRSGRTVEDASKALNALGGAVRNGAPPRRFIILLERILKSADKDASMDRLLQQLLGKLKEDGKGKFN